MHQMIELHPRADALDGLGLPAIPYPVALPVFQAAVANDGELPLAEMLHGLQIRAAEPASMERLEPAMARLAELLAADDTRDAINTRGDDWWLEIGPINLDGELVTIQRGESLLAAVTDRGDGRLRVATWRPLDAHAIRLLLDLALVPPGDPAADDTLTAWERAVTAATDRGQPLAAAGGDACLAYWPRGIGRHDDGRSDPASRQQAKAPQRRPACVVAELGSWHPLGDGPRA